MLTFQATEYELTSGWRMWSVLGQGPASPVNSIQISVAQVQLAAHQDDRGAGAEVLNLREPHGADMPQRVRIGQREAQHYHI